MGTPLIRLSKDRLAYVGMLLLHIERWRVMTLLPIVFLYTTNMEVFLVIILRFGFYERFSTEPLKAVCIGILPIVCQ